MYAGRANVREASARHGGFLKRRKKIRNPTLFSDLELSTFVDVNGSLEGKEESAYAALEFQDITETPDGRNEKLKFNGSASSKCGDYP